VAGNLLEYFSYSRLSTFKHCPAQFKIQYIDNIEQRYESIEAFTGKRIHEVMEHLYTKRMVKNQVPSLDELFEYLSTNWKLKWHSGVAIINQRNTSGTYYALAEKCLAWYYRNYYPFNESVVGIEYPFEITFSDKYKFIGYIDRLDRLSDNSLLIIDYKTGRRVMNANQAENDLQMTIYHLAIQENFPEASEIRLSWQYLQKGMVIEMQRNPKKLAGQKAKILKQAAVIEKSMVDGTFPAKESMLCNWCFYWNECPAKISNNPYIKVEA